ncbi:uncharacterized protein LOC100550012 [Meleagris gallopavo]|nr:uncharacterized protein LOC100550012 [Meleagris gallopavo]
MVPKAWYLVHGACYLVHGAWYLVPTAWYPVHGAWYLVRGAWYLVPVAWYLVRGACYPVPVPTRCCMAMLDGERSVWPRRRRFPAPRWLEARLPNEPPCTTPCWELPLTPPWYKTPQQRSARTAGTALAAAPQDPPEQRDCRPHRRSSMGQCNCRKKRKDNQELTDVERAIETVINQFHCYAVKGQKEYLTPNEMRELVVQKLPHLGKCVGPLDEKIECMGDPDEAKLEFGEYWDMMGDAAKGCRRK